MAIALVGTNWNRGSSATDPVAGLAFPSNNAAGNLLIAVIALSSNTVTVSGISDTRSNTWALAKRQAGTASQTVEIWYAMNCAAGANTVTVDLSGAINSSLWIAEFSGAATASATDTSGGFAYNNNVTTHESGGLTPSEAGTLVICGWCYGATATISSGPTDYTLIKEVYTRGSAYYRVVSDTAAQDPHDTTSSGLTSCGAIANFKAAAAAGDPEGSLVGGKLLRGGLLRHGVLVRAA